MEGFLVLAILDMLVSFREGDRSGGKEAIWLIDEGLGGVQERRQTPLVSVFWNQRLRGWSRQVFEIKGVAGKVFIFV